VKKLFRLTKDGINELQSELKTLLQERKAISERIKIAREFGDMAENAEYQSARHEQDRNESRIDEIEHILQNVEIIKSPRNDGKVRLGSVVKLKNGNGTAKEYQVVGTVEADPLSGKISDESPIGQALLGKKTGDELEIVTSTEKLTYKITAIS
jgi:transcription elongation factor GreA